MEVTLEQMLDAREERAQRQLQLSRKYGKTVLSFSMNIPGPVKDTPMIRRAFQAGLTELDCLIPSNAFLEKQVTQTVTGCEAVFSLDFDPVHLKTITSRIEDTHPLGRLFDMDVLNEKLRKLDREEIGRNTRGCIVCGAPGRDCASRRVHSVPELQQAVQRMLIGYFREAKDFHRIGTWAALSLLDEVCITPKPGLVDRCNSGSHHDMDISTFVASTAALVPYFRRCVQIGWETRLCKPETTFLQLRQAGLEAEQAMFRATKGINTHKGAIFTLGILCGAVGRHWSPGLDGCWFSDSLFQTVGEMTRDAMESDFRHMDCSTAGGRLFTKQGIRGIRGEVAQGLPSVKEIGLPVFRECLNEGMDYNEAGAVTLLHLISQVEDTNMLHRGGPGLAAEAREKAGALLPRPSLAQIAELDDWFRERNLSPGGCADLLAATIFVTRLILH